MPMDNHTAETPLADTRIRPQPKAPVPVCTVYADGSVRTAEGQALPMLDLQRLLLGSAAMVTQQLMEQAVRQEQVLVRIKTRYELDAETEGLIRALVERPTAPVGGS